MQRKFRYLAAMLICSLITVSAAPAAVEAAPKKPAKVRITSLTAGKKSVTIKWKKIKKAKGYQIYISSNKGFQDKFFDNTKKTSKSFKHLESGTKYYVKVRAYKKVGKKLKYGKWSSVEYIKTKKAGNSSSKDPGDITNPSGDDDTEIPDSPPKAHTHDWEPITETKVTKEYLIAPFSEGKNPPASDNMYKCLCPECRNSPGPNYIDESDLYMLKEHMEEVESLGWEEIVIEDCVFCDGCQLNMSLQGWDDHQIAAHCRNCGGRAWNWYTKSAVVDEILHYSITKEVYKNVVTGYKCSECGETRDANWN